MKKCYLLSTVIFCFLFTTYSYAIIEPFKNLNTNFNVKNHIGAFDTLKKNTNTPSTLYEIKAQKKYKLSKKLFRAGIITLGFFWLSGVLWLIGYLVLRPYKDYNEDSKRLFKYLKTLTKIVGTLLLAFILSFLALWLMLI